MNADPRPRREPTLAALAAAFARVSLSSFGGGNSAWIRRELVERRRWMTAEEFLAGYALCQILPGGTTVNLATFCGTKLRGTAGAIAACGGIVLPPVLLVLAIGAAYGAVGQTDAAQHILAGVCAAAIGLTLQMGISSARHRLSGRIDGLIALLVIIAVGWLRWPILPVIAVIGPVSIGLAYRRIGK